MRGLDGESPRWILYFTFTPLKGDTRIKWRISFGVREILCFFPPEKIVEQIGEDGRDVKKSFVTISPRRTSISVSFRSQNLFPAAKGQSIVFFLKKVITAGAFLLIPLSLGKMRKIFYSETKNKDPVKPRLN